MMSFKSYSVRESEYRYYGCPHAKEQTADNGCCRRYITEERLNTIVWETVKTLLDLTDVVVVKQEQKAADVGQRNADMVKELADLQRKLDKGNADRFQNVDQFMAGELEKELKEAEVARDDGIAEVLEQMKKYEEADCLDQKIVDAFVDCVMVYDPEHVEIKWNFRDEILEFIMG